MRPVVLINGAYEWAIKEGFLEEVSLSGALKERCGERLTPGRPPPPLWPSQLLSQLEAVYTSLTVQLTSAIHGLWAHSFAHHCAIVNAQLSFFRMDE